MISPLQAQRFLDSEGKALVGHWKTEGRENPMHFSPSIYVPRGDCLLRLQQC